MKVQLLQQDKSSFVIYGRGKKEYIFSFENLALFLSVTGEGVCIKPVIWTLAPALLQLSGHRKNA